MARKSVKRINKRVVLFATLLAICFIILIVCLVITNRLKKEKAYDDSVAAFQAFREEYEEETIMGRNALMLNEYKGAYSKTDLYKDLKRFANYMYYLKDNIAIAPTEDFYEKERSNIKNRLGITSYTKYKAFVDELANHDVSEEKFRYCKFLSAVGYIDDYFTFDMEFYYKDANEQDYPVRFTVGWSYHSTNDIDVKYSFSENQ